MTSLLFADDVFLLASSSHDHQLHWSRMVLYSKGQQATFAALERDGAVF